MNAACYQQYAWGKKGKESVVAKLKGLGDSKYTVKPEETYAEMWIGTHPSGPSRVIRDGCPGPLLKVSLLSCLQCRESLVADLVF